jgi:putative salt-induced outer membrane protein
MKIWSVLIVLLLTAVAASADTVVMKNGDHLTGTVEKSDGKVLTIKTEYGEVALPWPAIKEISIDSKVYVDTADKRTVVGTAKTEDGKLVVTPVSGPSATVALTDVKAVRSQTGFNAVRSGEHDKILLYEASIYSSDRSMSNPTTANDIRGGAAYQRDVTPRFFGFVSGDWEYNGPQELDLRSIYSFGVGVHAIKKDTTNLDLLAGINYTKESYSTSVDRNLGGLTLGDVYMHKFGKSTTLNQDFYIYPDLTDTGNYRMAFDLAVVTQIHKWLGWQTTASDRYLSNPIPGTRSNDLILTTGINVAFGPH